MESGDWLAGGEVEILGRITWGDGLDQYRYAVTRFQRSSLPLLKRWSLSNSLNNPGICMGINKIQKILPDEFFHGQVYWLTTCLFTFTGNYMDKQISLAICIAHLVIKIKYITQWQI
jgi:hypothetical protein